MPSKTILQELPVKHVMQKFIANNKYLIKRTNQTNDIKRIKLLWMETF